MMRLALPSLLLLAGCGSLGFVGEAPPPQVAASNAPTASAMLFPDGLLEEVGPGAEDAIARAQADALQSDTAGVAVLWTYEDLSGRVVPGPSYMVNTRLCRDLLHVAEKQRKRISGRATLCLSREGTWERVG